MRHLLILAVLVAGPAAAQTAGQAAGDRYGGGDAAASARGAQVPVRQRYSGRVLTWSGKTLAAPPAGSPSTAPQLRGVAPAAAPAAFRPQAPLSSQAPAPMRQPPVLRQAQAAAVPPTAPQARTAPAAPRAPLPTSLYGASTSPRGPVLAGGPPRPAGPEARLYSLHREYGLQPDAIPESPAGPRYVLMGPPDPAAPKPGADARPGGLADAPF